MASTLPITLVPSSRVITRVYRHRVILRYLTAAGAPNPITGHAITMRLRASRAADSAILATYTVAAYGSDGATFSGTIESATTAGLAPSIEQAWLFCDINGPTTDSVPLLLVKCPVTIL